MGEQDGYLVAITGGSRGIGFATAQYFAREGFSVALIGRSAESKVDKPGVKLQGLTEACAAIEAQANGIASSIVADLANTNSILSTAFQIVEIADRRKIILINNAGLFYENPGTPQPPHIHAAMRDINSRAPILLSDLLKPAVQVLVSTTGTLLHYDHNDAYQESKEFAERGSIDEAVRGMITRRIYPGSVDTPMVAQSDAPYKVKPEEVARTIFNLTWSTYTTDAMIHPTPETVVRSEFSFRLPTEERTNAYDRFHAQKARVFGAALRDAGVENLLPDVREALQK